MPARLCGAWLPYPSHTDAPPTGLYNHHVGDAPERDGANELSFTEQVNRLISVVYRKADFGDGYGDDDDVSDHSRDYSDCFCRCFHDVAQEAQDRATQYGTT